MDVRGIVKDWLITHNYDGLAGDECGCGIEDLMACGDGFENCVAGHKAPCDCGEGCAFHICAASVPSLKDQCETFEARCKAAGICSRCGEAKHEGDCKRLRNSVSIENMLRNSEQAKGK